MPKPIQYSEQELSWIKAHSTLPRREAHKQFCAKFKRQDVNLDNFKALCKRKGWMTGRTGCFEKGHVPDNKGKKMPYNPASAATQFKKGHKPHNAKPVGHERLSKDGYVEISIRETNPHTGADTRYVHKHRLLWEKKNGPIPEGMVLKCLDSNKQNTDPDNWEAIPRGALPFLNGHRGHNYDAAPEDVKPAILGVAKLKYATGQKRREKGNSHD